MPEIIIVLIGFYAGLLVGVPTGIGVEMYLEWRRKKNVEHT